MNSTETALSHGFTNPTAFSDTQPQQVQYSAQPTTEGQLQTVVVTQPPPPPGTVAVVPQDPLEQEIQKTAQCAWATLGSCFWPISIVALVYTCKAKNALKAGNRAEAEKYDGVATRLSWSSCITGLVLWIIGISVLIYFQVVFSKM